MLEEDMAAIVKKLSLPDPCEQSIHKILLVHYEGRKPIVHFEELAEAANEIGLNGFRLTKFHLEPKKDGVKGDQPEQYVVLTSAEDEEAETSLRNIKILQRKIHQLTDKLGKMDVLRETESVNKQKQERRIKELEQRVQDLISLVPSRLVAELDEIPTLLRCEESEREA
jgi:hypothetical protein